MGVQAVKQIHLGDISVDVALKSIKNIHLSVYPPNGRVRVAAPLRMDLETIRVFALSKLGWIKQQQKKLRAQARQAQMEYLERESHYVWGKRYLLKVIEQDAQPCVAIKGARLLLQVRPGSEETKRQSLLSDWYRRQLREEAQVLIEKWAPRIGVELPWLTVRQMKTKWGSCTPATRHILINLELAKKPQECLEYIVVHELVHLLEPSHSNRFIALMTQFMPKWRFYREELNRLPVRHEDWSY
ncbi:M48 family metallopeptidase [Curvibacter delicatus]|jgi:predicted metal-dependent hydrolase|uniref:M48 family metallopeptidase n=1 Tax=Curvibacter delicatus TaxID=80879 RepID=UPI0008355272|nr:SprT family zinc-dependent metalloprotease [Curvibacter delicatus]